MKTLTTTLVLGTVLTAMLLAPAHGAEKKAKAAPRKADPSLAQIQDEPGLPRVLLIGDSISIGYTVPVRNLMKGKANVHRIPANGGPTPNGLAKLKNWLGDGKWDVIHFNWGLHDLKFMADGKQQVALDQYEKNLRELVKQLQATGAKLVWCSTTPVPDAPLTPPRKNSDVIAFNAVAKKIMTENKVAVDDLYAYTLPELAKVQRPTNVHFTDEGSQFLAKQVVKSLAAALGKTK